MQNEQWLPWTLGGTLVMLVYVMHCTYLNYMTSSTCGIESRSPKALEVVFFCYCITPQISFKIDGTNHDCIFFLSKEYLLP